MTFLSWMTLKTLSASSASRRHIQGAIATLALRPFICCGPVGLWGPVGLSERDRPLSVQSAVGLRTPSCWPEDPLVAPPSDGLVRRAAVMPSHPRNAGFAAAMYRRCNRLPYSGYGTLFAFTRLLFTCLPLRRTQVNKNR
jgi:hypothetical protein